LEKYASHLFAIEGFYRSIEGNCNTNITKGKESILILPVTTDLQDLEGNFKKNQQFLRKTSQSVTCKLVRRE